MKKKNTIWLFGVIFSVVGFLAYSKQFEWQLDLTFKAKSEKQTQLGQNKEPKDKTDMEITQ